VTEHIAGHPWREGRTRVFEVRRHYRNRPADFARTLPWAWSIGPIRSNDLPLEGPRFDFASMTVSLAAAYFALLAAVLHFVSYKLKKTAERKSFHFKDTA
jgi:hypothetical protein